LGDLKIENGRVHVIQCGLVKDTHKWYFEVKWR